MIVKYLLLIFGQLKPEGQKFYIQYLKGTQPLMQKYRVQIMAVGSGAHSHYFNEQWPINALLGFYTYEEYLSFFQDPEYQLIKERYRDPAYQTLHLQLFKVNLEKEEGTGFHVNHSFKTQKEIGLVLYREICDESMPLCGWLKGEGVETKGLRR